MRTQQQQQLKNFGSLNAWFCYIFILFYAIPITNSELKFGNVTNTSTPVDIQRNSKRPFNSFKSKTMDNSYESFEHHPCRRICQHGKTLTCHYKLVVHNYQRLGPECNRCLYDERECAAEHCIYGDGVPTPVMAVNAMLPGPQIEVCENDTVIVDVQNQLTESTTMHWHGLCMRQTPEMDGVPFVTQYPLQPAEIQRYSFKADQLGTMWYHSHVGWQRALGVAGSFVVRQAGKLNPHARLYDYDLTEHTLLIGDIIYNNDYIRVTNILINGKGRNHTTNLPDNDPTHRYERLRVTSGYRYRIRVISNGIFDCPIEFSVEQHRMLLISTDGSDIVPVLVDSFFITSGERFDFVLDANQHANNYWIRARGYGFCSLTNLYQGAVLHYRGTARSGPPFIRMNETVFGQSNEIVLVNALSELKMNTNFTRIKINIATAALQSLYPLSWSPNTKFLTYYSSFGAHIERNGNIYFQINDITYKPPVISMLQGRSLYEDSEYFCNRSSLVAAGEDCVRNNCKCTNVLRVPAYKPIEIVVANYMNSTHPFHLHGYEFRLVGQGAIGNLTKLRMIEELDRLGGLKRAAPDYPAVQKDTAQIPALGYIIIRFISDNPGFWLQHCHIELHAVSGMVAVLKVGENNQIKSIPPRIHC